MLPLKIFPSLLSADLGNLQAEIDRLEPFVDGFHFDVMDGHFVPNLTMGAPVLKKIKTQKIFDVHLMVSNPANRIAEFAKAGAHAILFHIEAAGEQASALVRNIKESGMRAGVALKPKTPLETIITLLPELDYVLIMSVEPGFSGQKFMPEVLEKIRKLRQDFPNLDIEIDGGINAETIAAAREAGANLIVTGSYFFQHPNPAEAARILRG